jgi:hypothetical protein
MVFDRIERDGFIDLLRIFVVVSDDFFIELILSVFGNLRR